MESPIARGAVRAVQADCSCRKGTWSGFLHVCREQFFPLRPGRGCSIGPRCWAPASGLTWRDHSPSAPCTEHGLKPQTCATGRSSSKAEPKAGEHLAVLRCVCPSPGRELLAPFPPEASLDLQLIFHACLSGGDHNSRLEKTNKKNDNSHGVRGTQEVSGAGNPLGFQSNILFMFGKRHRVAVPDLICSSISCFNSETNCVCYSPGGSWANSRSIRPESNSRQPQRCPCRLARRRLQSAQHWPAAVERAGTSTHLRALGPMEPEDPQVQPGGARGDPRLTPAVPPSSSLFRLDFAAGGKPQGPASRSRTPKRVGPRGHPVSVRTNTGGGACSGRRHVPAPTEAGLVLAEALVPPV